MFQLVPVPFLDDWLTTKLRRRLVRTVLHEAGISFDPGVPRIAARWDEGSLFERLRHGTLGLAVKPLRKAFRTVFLWMAARRAVRSSVETYFLGRFWGHPELRLAFESTHLDPETARSLSGVFGRLVEGIDGRLTSDAVRRIWRLLKVRARGTAGAPVDADAVAEALEQEQPGFVAEFDRSVAEHLRRQFDIQPPPARPSHLTDRGLDAHGGVDHRDGGGD